MFIIRPLRTFPKGRLEALIVSILLGTARIDPDRLNADTFQPIPERCCRDLGTITRSNVLWFASLEQQSVKRFQHILASHLPRHRHGQRLTGVFIEHCQHLVRVPIAQLVMNGAIDRRH